MYLHELKCSILKNRLKNLVSFADTGNQWRISQDALEALLINIIQINGSDKFKCIRPFWSLNLLLYKWLSSVCYAGEIYRPLAIASISES